MTIQFNPFSDDGAFFVHNEESVKLASYEYLEHNFTEDSCPKLKTQDVGNVAYPALVVMAIVWDHGRFAHVRRSWHTPDAAKAKLQAVIDHIETGEAKHKAFARPQSVQKEPIPEPVRPTPPDLRMMHETLGGVRQIDSDGRYMYPTNPPNRKST